MDENNKVFSSNITRGQKCLKNNLQDLLDVVPAVPSAPEKEGKDHKCEFQPKNDKYYIPKKRSKFKVKTVRDIRNVFEKDVFSYLPDDLDRQHNIIFKKITHGSFKNDNTKTLAKNILKSENPISRSSWQMLMNLNPEDQANCVQYVFWNGRRIRVNGSKGGKSKFLCNFDLGRKNLSISKKKLIQKKPRTQRKMLLHNSLTVKFKPGPLTKKKFLDDSYQRYNVGSTELVKLPKLGLDVQPTYGLVLEPSINIFLQNLRNKDGTVSKNWAEFSVSVLGTRKNFEIVQNDPKSYVTFDLNYKSDQRRILMRRDIDSQSNKNNVQNNVKPVIYSIEDESSILQETETILDKILDSVEISLKQDDMFSGVDEQREISSKDLSNFNNIQTKDKVKRNTELERLAVTIIRLPDAPPEERKEKCQKSHCALGCVCASLQGSYNLKQHCGRFDCMFECKCDFSKYKLSDSIENTCPELIPGILNISNEINLSLAKEEQKFHQTVVMTGEKSILMRSERRNWKTSKKYAEFYQGLSLKTGITHQPVLSVVDLKLDLENVEPWCMVHNLYKCFCKGKFTENSVALVALDKSENVELDVSHEASKDTCPNENDTDITSLCIKSRPSIKRGVNLSDTSESKDLEPYTATCARSRPYTGRKYYNSYYLKTNKKIEQLEKNDQSLYKKMMTLINKSDEMIKTHKSRRVINKGDGNKPNDVKYKDLDSNDISLLENISDNNDSTCISTNMTYLNKPDEMELSRSSSSVCDENSNSSNFLSDNVFSEMISSQFTLSEETSTNQTTDKTSQSKRLPNKNKLRAWLESSYKQYKQRLDKGIVKTALEPPKEGKIALYPWEFILSRYRERKNLFLISKQRPFRIFMAVDMKNALFKNCINIDDIRFADLHKYPITVKNLLTNATDLKDIFFILSGLACCWELIGSVTKINEPKEKESESNEVHSNTKSSLESDIMSLSNKDIRKTENSLVHNIELDNQEADICDDKESSKWFVMTIENDFSEIKFYKRGFFVKYESIIKAINVARMTGKTVRLSSQKTTDTNEGPQFGIYAIPNVNEYCVFIGPYDKDEFLDLETVKSISDVGKPKNTRGVWITTKKVDNLKVIDNPLSFMPNVHSSTILNLQSETVPDISNKKILDSLDNTLTGTETAKISPIKQPQQHKLVKPIKIRRTNGFYHLNPQSFLKPIIPHKVSLPEVPQGVAQKILIQCSSQNRRNNTLHVTNPSLLRNTSSTFCDPWPHRTPFTEENKVTVKPVAEIAPQIKIVNVYSEATTIRNQESHEPTTLKREKGMFVLKPEEINKKMMDKQRGESETLQLSFSSDSEINEDIENFLATSHICTLPNPDDLINLENEGGESDLLTNKLVFIECKSIENLGWIRGQKNHEDKISFQFPGFKYTCFYNMEEAFSKINQVLSRKVYIPKNIKIEWQVVDTFENLKTKKMLTASHLGIAFVLTKRGLRHKRDLMANVRLSSKLDAYCSSSSDNGSTVFEDYVDKASEIFDELEEENKKIEDESNQLLNKMKEREENLKVLLRESDTGPAK